MALSRRQVLGGAAAGLGVAALSLASAQSATADPGRIAATMRRARAVPGTALVEPTDFPLTHLSLGWPASDGVPSVRLRKAADWRPWQVVTGCDCGRDGGIGLRHGGLLVASGVTGYEVSSPAGGVALGEINVLDGPVLRAVGAPLTLTLGGLLLTGYRSRAAWGADESLRFDPKTGAETWPSEYYPVQALTVHHTVTQLDDPDPAATVRGIYTDHAITRGYGDIGYHLLIDAAGTVYEGRWSGDDGLPVLGGPLGPNARPQMNTAGHVVGYNIGNVGIALLGDFTDVAPTSAAVGSLVRVLALLSTLCGLDPKTTTTYANPVNGNTATVQTISGHRDWDATACPGNKLYPLLPEIRRRAASPTAVLLP
ncbi:MAG: N-acetylmuramoyl-L-alanine amidase family 2 [Pseudonocardia sp.]|nr:N-acetylmuramoyl-L-alanine amidase family 2 [Pseudonocardia sp.]